MLFWVFLACVFFSSPPCKYMIQSLAPRGTIRIGAIPHTFTSFVTVFICVHLAVVTVDSTPSEGVLLDCLGLSVSRTRTLSSFGRITIAKLFFVHEFSFVGGVDTPRYPSLGTSTSFALALFTHRPIRFFSYIIFEYTVPLVYSARSISPMISALLSTTATPSRGTTCSWCPNRRWEA